MIISVVNRKLLLHSSVNLLFTFEIRDQWFAKWIETLLIFNTLWRILLLLLHSRLVWFKRRYALTVKQAFTSWAAWFWFQFFEFIVFCDFFFNFWIVMRFGVSAAILWQLDLLVRQILKSIIMTICHFLCSLVSFFELKSSFFVSLIVAFYFVNNWFFIDSSLMILVLSFFLLWVVWFALFNIVAVDLELVNTVVAWLR